MAENKKSFILYCDLIHTVSKMPDEKAGQLLKHILAYVNDQNPATNDLIIELTFEPIKQQLKRDLQKYYDICERNKTNGDKGGRPKTQRNPKKPTGLSGNPDKPKKPDIDTDIDTVNVKEKIIKLSKEQKFFIDIDKVALDAERMTKFKEYCNDILANCENVFAMKKPLTAFSFYTLIKAHNKDIVLSKIRYLDNSTKIKNYSDTFKTVNNWCKDGGQK